MSSLVSTVHNNMIKRLVGQRITDADGQVLDVRTVVVIDDADGDPAAVFSPDEWKRVTATARRLGKEPLTHGYRRGHDYGAR